MPSFLHLPSNSVIQASGSRASRFRRSAYFVELSDSSTKAPYSPPDASESSTTPPDNPAVPDGTVAEILDWAGEDPQRRQAALQAEQQGKHRVTLIRALQP